MKKVFALSLISMSLNCFAEFYDVKEKFCNEAKADLGKDEKIFIDSLTTPSIIGFGHTLKDDCIEVNFVASSATLKNDEVTRLEVAFNVGRRTSCVTEVLPYNGFEIKMMELFKGKLVVYPTETSPCEKLTFIF